MKRTTSAKQIAANRRNAMKSTGPRTARGREASRMNAFKHGILSRQVLVQGRVLQEDEAELEALHRRFWEQFQPEGPLEEMLLDQIVTAHWRLRRALTAESGEIALSVDRRQRGHSRGRSPAVQWMEWTVLGDPVHAMQGSSIGSSILCDWLTGLREKVEAAGSLPEAEVQKLAGRLGENECHLVRPLKEFLQRQQADAASPEKHQAGLLAFLDGQIRGFQLNLERRAVEEEYEAEASQAAAVLPSGEVLDKIMRYETKLERQMYRAMAQLERVQRMRSGEAVPAPLSVEVTDRP